MCVVVWVGDGCIGAGVRDVRDVCGGMCEDGDWCVVACEMVCEGG